MAGEFIVGLSIFKTLYDSAKALKDINDGTIRNGAVIELQEKILAAREAQSALLDRISELERKVAGFEEWNAKEEKYELKDLGRTAFAYMLKPNARGTASPHWICTHCYGNQKIEIIQHTNRRGKDSGNGLICPGCHNEIRPSPNALMPGTGSPRWLD